MDNFFALSSKKQEPSNILQNGGVSLSNWLNGFENKNVTGFEAIANIASDICQTPIALIALIEDNHFNFKSANPVSDREMRRAEAVSRKVVRDGEFVQYAEINNLTGEMISCVGIPFKTSEDELVGVLCVINYNREKLSENEKTALENLAKLTTLLLEQGIPANKEEKQHLKFLEANTSVEMFLVSPADLKIIYANHNALKSLGYPTDCILNQEITEILVAKKREEFQQRLLDLAVNENNSFSMFVEQVNFDGSKKLVKVFVSFVREDFESSILIVSKNLSNVGFESDFVDYLNNYDSVTGLANRRMFENLLSEKIHTSDDTPEQSGLLLIDLENFRLLNKSFGYRAGDNVIRQFSKILVEFLGSEEILVRNSQDSFCVLLPNCNESQIRHKAIEIIDLVSNQNFSENNKKFKLQINIGAVLISPEDSRNKDYLSLAHKACDIAKEFGQNQFYLADPLDPLFIQKTIEMEQLVNVHDAIERNKLLLYAQKIGRISNDAEGFTEHYEILIRMLNKDGDAVPPLAFIPQLEKHGSIVSLDKWVLKESLKMIDERHQNMENTESGKKFMYNINLSARTISDACFISYCTELLIKYRHLAQFICFEITETVAISNFKTVQEFIHIIRRFGCKFALDDFGSGGASLEYLKQLSVDFVKIDGTFISDIVENPISQIIVESICKVAKVLKIDVIAEKVETQAIEEALVKFGVQYIQGYKIQRPTPFLQMV